LSDTESEGDDDDSWTPESDLLKENYRNINSRSSEVVDLLSSGSEGEFSSSPVKNRRKTLKKNRENSSVHLKSLTAFAVQQIPALSVQKSHLELKKQSPSLHKLVVRSRRSLNLFQINAYNDKLRQAQSFELRKKWADSAECYLEAFAICDDDISLHKKLFLYEKILA